MGGLAGTLVSALSPIAGEEAGDQGAEARRSERDLRSFVIWRKKCFGSQSERGLRFAERVMALAHTLRKRGRTVLEFFEQTIGAQLTGLAAPRITA